VQALKAHDSKVAIDESTLEEAQKQVPREYWEFLDVFSKKSSECMPLRKPWDHGIDLKEDFLPKKKSNRSWMTSDYQELFPSDGCRACGYSSPSG